DRIRRRLHPVRAEVATHPRADGLGRAGDAVALDGDQFRPDGGGQPVAPAEGGLALVYRVTVRLRVGGVGRGDPLGEGAHPPPGARPGADGALCDRPLRRQTRRQGDKETRGEGMNEQEKAGGNRLMKTATKADTGRTVFVSLSPCLLVSLSLLAVGCDLP